MRLFLAPLLLRPGSEVSVAKFKSITVRFIVTVRARMETSDGAIQQTQRAPKSQRDIRHGRTSRMYTVVGKLVALVLIRAQIRSAHVTGTRARKPIKILS